MYSSKYAALASVTVLLFLLVPVVAEFVVVAEIMDHSMDVDTQNFEVTHTLRAASNLALKDIVITDYFPEDLVSGGAPVNYNGEKRYEAVLNLDELKSGSVKTLKHSFTPQKNGNFIIYSKVTYFLDGEQHQMLAQKSAIITNSGQNSKNISGSILISIFIVCVLAALIYRTRKKHS